MCFPSRWAGSLRLDPVIHQPLLQEEAAIGWLLFTLFHCKSALCKCNLGAAISCVWCGVWCLRLQGSSCSSWDISVLLDSGTVKWGMGEVWGWTDPNWCLLCESILELWCRTEQSPEAPHCLDAPGFLSLYVVRVDSLNTTLLQHNPKYRQHIIVLICSSSAFPPRVKNNGFISRHKQNKRLSSCPHPWFKPKFRAYPSGKGSSVLPVVN